MKNAFTSKIYRMCLALCLTLFAWQFAGAQTYSGSTGAVPPVGTSGTSNFTVNVPLTGTIGSGVTLESVNITDLNHTFDGDLEFRLISPGGASTQLVIENRGGSLNDFTNTVLQDGAATNVSTGAAPFTGTFEPEGGDFAVNFSGDNVNGNWTLEIEDELGGDSGFMFDWSLTFAQQACEITCPGDISRSNDPGVCGAFVTVPAPTVTGATCAGIGADYVDYGPVTANLNIAPFNPAQNTLGVTNFNQAGVSANAALGTTVTISGEWNSDNSFFTEEPALTAEGIFVGNLTSGGADCQANTFSYEMSSADWNTVAANGSIDWQVAADIDVNSFCAIDIITLSANVATSSVLYANDYNGSQDASDFYPVGTTTVCFITNDVAGGTVQCCIDITVTDDEGPQFQTCPNDIIVNLDAGECASIISWDFDVVDNCPPASSTFDLGPGVIGFLLGINCNNGAAVLETWHYRTWTVPAGVVNASVESITVGVENAPANAFFDVSVHTGGGAFPGGALTTVATGDFVFPGAVVNTFETVPVNATGTLNAGDVVVIEIHAPGQSPAWFFGYGADIGVTTYIESSACGAPASVPLDNFGLSQDLNLAINLVPQGIETVRCDMTPYDSGDEYPYDESPFPICYSATDVAGNVTLCEFNIIVNEYANPTATLACNDNVQVSLDATGCATIGADMILEGGPYGCYDDYIVDIVALPGYPNDQACCSELGGPWVVMVEDPDTGNKCWGSIIVEDKLDPIIECEDYTIACTEDIDDLLGTSFAATKNFDSGPRPSFDGATDDVEFDVSAPGSATITDINVSLDISHTWVDDLDITLIAPDGTSLILWNDQCGLGDDVDVTIDDDGVPFFCSGTPAIAGVLQPTGGALADFNGMAAAGLWTVRVTDDVGADPTNINNIQLQISYAGSYDPPVVTDNCTVVSFTYLDTFESDDCSGDAGTITRIWTAVDQSGNSSTCTSTITVERPGLDDVMVPPSLDDIEAPSLDCSGNPWDTNGDAYPQPNESGEPTINGIAFENGDICGITAYYDDTVLPICNNSFKVRREWVITDWCTGDEIVYVQFVKVIDTTGPDVVCPAGPLTIDVYQGGLPGGPHDICTGTVVIQPITVNGDDCSGLAPADYVTELWTLGAGLKLQEIAGNGGAFFEVELEADNPPSNNAQYTIRHLIYDECGNVTECIYDIVVVDKVPPVPICDEITEISITNNGGSGEGCSVLPAEVLDDGSYDNCGDVYFYAAKMNPFLPPPYFYQYYPSLEFCCDEIGENMVILLVLDFDPSAFALPDGSIFLLPGQAAFEGSFNTCMVTVEVTDKIPPITIFCPGPETITCEEYVDDYAASVNNGDYGFLDAFGEAQFYDNCATNIDYTVTVDINSCQEGTIVRSWVATDDNPQNASASCTQTIFVEHVSDWVVEFPADIVAECTDGQLPEFGEPEVYFDECELIGISYEDQYFYVVPDACYKIVRTWTAINWCIYEDWGYDAFSEADHFEAAYFADWDGDGDSDDRTFRDGYNTDGTADGYIVYEQVIKVNDSEAPEFVIPEIDGCIVDTDCDTDITIPYPDILDQCSVTFEVDLSGDFGTYTDIQGDITIDDVVPGEYTIYYVVTDNCGNSSYDQVTVVVEDCKLPTPYCLNGIVVEIMQTQMIEVWASDLNLGSFDNCPGALIYSFSPDVTDLAVTYTCDDLGQNPVEIWVTDAAGNQDFCETFIVVQDNMGFCTSAPVVAGIIATEEDETVQDVTVDVNGGLFSQVTGADGYYTFNLAGGNDYTITPMNDLNASNGVTTYDLVLISMHILGVQPLDSPYKLIAADANNSESITTLDMVAIRKLILQVENDFPNNTSWRFVDADYNFPVPTNPWSETFPEVLNYNDIATSDLEGDFVGVKIGDVNASAAANGLAGVDNRTMVDDIVLHTEAQSVKAGELYTVTFTADQIEVLGYQFTLNFDQNALELMEIVAGSMSEENFGTSLLSEGAITASWNVADAQVLSGDLFSLVFKASADAELVDLLSIGSRYTVAEGYNAEGELLNVQLDIDGSVATAGFELYQNVPNPFKGNTVIGFNLPEATSATLTITDVSGKVLRVIQSDYAKGYNEVNVSDLTATGVLYYKLETSNDTATRKMILVK